MRTSPNTNAVRVGVPTIGNTKGVTSPISLGIPRNSLGPIAKTIDAQPSTQISPSTGGGQEIVALPPTVVSPPNAAGAVLQAIQTSPNLAENTATGLGIGNNQNATIKTVVTNTKGAVIVLALLGLGLVVTILHEKGKL